MGFIELGVVKWARLGAFYVIKYSKSQIIVTRNMMAASKWTSGIRYLLLVGGMRRLIPHGQAIRYGVKDVTILYRRSYEEMLADRNEIEEAITEGVKIEYLAMPVGIIKRDGELQGLECIKTELGEPDESGRRSPVPIKGSELAEAIQVPWL